MATAQITLMLEIDVVDDDLEPIDSSHEKWEESQDVCIEAAIEKLENSLVGLEFSATIQRD